MENRIEVNGVWYVREDAIIDPLDHLEAEEITTTNSLTCTYESDDWAFEAFVILRDEAKTLEDHYPDPSIQITDKRLPGRDAWTVEDVDNPIWMRSILENDPESMKEARDMFDPNGLREFKDFLRHLEQKGWL